VIGKLRGKVDSVRDDYLILDVGGVGYLVFASSRTLSVVEPVQGEVSLIIETHVREDHIHLYGFMNEAEREWFRLLPLCRA
jgi:Holliday junction DNA helicase RuvA